ncbi:MAG: hypothetical protein GQ574_11105 [Crocinitomix sp.]|nr:hypothetical protein [Crocinitomix sp.]
MRICLIFLFLLMAYGGFSQDTLFFKNGKILPVQIVELDTNANLVGYVHQNDTIYASIRSFEKISYAGKARAINGYASSAVIQDSEEARANIIRKSKPNPKYLYGKWALSTNLTSVFSSNEDVVYSNNPVFSIEPEYFANNYFSIKFPVHVGVPKKLKLGSFYNQPFSLNEGTEVGDLPSARYYLNYHNQLGHVRNLLFQLGLNPKWYFKGQRTFGWYLSQGFYLAQINLNRVDYYYTFVKSVNGYYNTYDGGLTLESFKEKKWIFRYEGAIGLSVNVIKDIGITAELGYTTFIRFQV